MEKSIGSSNRAEIGLAPHQSNSGSANSKKTRKKGKELVLGTFLGLDFGKSKIGMAMADSETRMAFAYGTFKNDKDFPMKLREIIEKENVEAIIIGIPAYKHDSGEIQKFAGKIVKDLDVKIEYQNEMFTTKMAQENIKERGGKNIAESDDQEAARIILQEWLDHNYGS